MGTLWRVLWAGGMWDVTVDSSGRQYVDVPTALQEHLRITFVSEDQARYGVDCFRVQIGDATGQLREGLEFPVAKFAHVVQAMMLTWMARGMGSKQFIDVPTASQEHVRTSFVAADHSRYCVDCFCIQIRDAAGQLQQALESPIETMEPLVEAMMMMILEHATGPPVGEC
ncbi:MAG: hypothetical protein AB7N53_14895 [Candidatus Binatia bacterium]